MIGLQRLNIRNLMGETESIGARTDWTLETHVLFTSMNFMSYEWL